MGTFPRSHILFTQRPCQGGSYFPLRAIVLGYSLDRHHCILLYSGNALYGSVIVRLRHAELASDYTVEPHSAEQSRVVHTKLNTFDPMKQAWLPQQLGWLGAIDKAKRLHSKSEAAQCSPTSPSITQLPWSGRFVRCSIRHSHHTERRSNAAFNYGSFLD